ncbi:MAG: N-6 DNA methylase [Candidatus Lokiarchaeota archaeon]|nr:N-6 DNA methylase [Candidatus Lokiarchaeota archaeon]
MEQGENLNHLKKFIETIFTNIENRNFQELQIINERIEPFERNFLKLYHRRKKEGVFYTDESLTNYISLEALLLLVNNKLNEENSNSVRVQDIKDIWKLNIEMQQKLTNILLNLTICDPACGSGGFLLSAVEIIFKIVTTLNPNLSKLDTKKQLLKNLYGFDINIDALNLSILKLLGWIYDANDEDMPQIVSQLRGNFKLINTLTHSNIPRFDVILGNPPYGNILNRNEKEFFKKEKIFYNDIYCAFILKALNWASEIVGFLVPKSFLLRQGYIEFRNRFLSKANILKIIDIGSKQFKNATNEVQVLLFENKRKANSRDLEIYDFPNSRINTYTNQDVDSLKVCFNVTCPLCVKSKKLYVYTYHRNCPYCGSKTVELNRIRIKPNPLNLQIINKIEKNGDLNYLNPKMFPKMIRGEEDKGLSLVKKKLTNQTQKSCFFINARNDFRYYYLRKNRSFNIEEIDADILKGNNFEYYLSPKLLIKHNNIIPEAIYTEENVCFTSSIYSLLYDDPAELKYLCAVLNSILIQFYCIYAINNQKNTTINLNQYMIRHLPIATSDNQTKVKLANDVDKIILLFEKNEGFLTERTKELIRNLDDTIMKLYLMTEKEKKIIISDVKNRVKYFSKIYH